MNGKNLKFCLVGKDIQKSLSPIIFDYWFRLYDFNYSYCIEEVGEEDFDRRIIDIINIYDGINITSPYKERILEKINNISKLAEKSKAANCLWKKKAYNTDILGFKKAISNSNIQINKVKAAILGAGGAARAVREALDDLNIKNRVLDRKKIERLSRSKLENIVEDELIINCTTKKNLLVDFINQQKYIDINYNRGESFEESLALKMLVYQAQENFRIWFGFEPEINKDLFQAIRLS